VRCIRRKAGATPLLAKDYLTALDVAKAVKRRPIAGRLFVDGEAEVSLYADDPDTGIPLRGRGESARLGSSHAEFGAVVIRSNHSVLGQPVLPVEGDRTVVAV